VSDKSGKALSRREFLKQAGMGIAGLVAANTLGACGPQATATPTARPTTPPTKPTATAVPPTAVPAEKAKIVWWTEAAPESVQNGIRDLFLKPFNDSHPNIELELEFVANLSDSINTAVAGGGGPDIIEVAAPQVIDQYFESGYVLALDAFADQFGWANTIAPWALTGGTYKGNLVSLQLTQDSELLVYNKGLLEEKGWTIPKEADEVEDIVKKCLDNNIIPYASHNAWPVYHSVIWNDYASALSVYKWLTNQIPFTSDEFVGACEHFKKMVNEGWMGPDVWDMSFGSEWALLSTGQALMKMDMTTAFKVGADSFEQFDWDVAPLPNLREGITHCWQVGSGESLALSADCKHPEAAAEVLNFIYADPKRAGQIMALNPGEWVVPIRVDPEDIPETMDHRQRKTIAWINEAAMENKVGYVTWTWWPLPTLSVTMDLGGQQLSGEISSEDFCAKVQEQFEKDYAAGMVKPMPVTYGA
jgi:raffinose/stachyose/melibiose transport system substrate-binding protein